MAEFRPPDRRRAAGRSGLAGPRRRGDRPLWRGSTTIWPNWRGNPTTALVTSGPYRVGRNPQYVGIALLHIAFAFALGIMWALALLPVLLVFLDRFVIPREEVYLERKFGQADRDYEARVRRWL